MAYTTIKKPSDYFNTKTYSGTGSGQSITGVGFQPDFTWIKHREDISNHRLFDAVRGANKNIKTNDTDGEVTASDQLMSFDSDGFTLGADGSVNATGSAGICSWNWKANGAGSSNTVGDIASTVSANTTSGFSIITYTGNGTSGATIGHGLGAVPKMIITKRTDSANGWGVYHHTLGTGKELYLNYDLSEQSTNFWITTPTTSVFSVSNSDYVNLNTATYVAYCFAEKQGFSKFGSYTGNGSATDGTFVYTGFKPSFIMFKSTSTTGGWEIHDNKRDTFNPSSKRLFAHLSSAEATENYVDFVSNGFKFRTSDANGNTSGTSYIYMAFAEEPLVGDNPATAR